MLMTHVVIDTLYTTRHETSVGISFKNQMEGAGGSPMAQGVHVVVTMVALLL